MVEIIFKLTYKGIGHKYIEIKPRKWKFFYNNSRTDGLFPPEGFQHMPDIFPDKFNDRSQGIIIRSNIEIQSPAEETG